MDGKPVYRKGFGLASMELPVRLSPAIRMRASLATRHFTSLAYLLLCEQGKAGIDDPLGKYFPEFHRVTRMATMRQLMRTETEATVSASDKGARLKTAGRFGSMTYDLIGVADGIWRVKSASKPFLGGMLTLDEDGRTCRFSDTLTLALPLRKV